ncbi:MAG: carbohydrate kinase family protein [Chordicoccus sp.]
MEKKVITAGHICLDITPLFPERRVEALSDILQPGKLIQVGEADIHTGGSVANTGLAMKIFGADVSLMGKIGTDAFGDIVMRIVRQYGAGADMIRDPQESTSYSAVLAVPGIDRIFLHHPGANNSFRASDIPGTKLAETALFHFGYPTLMASMYAHEGAELTALMRKAKDAGCATSLDLAAVDASSAAGRADWKGILARTLPYVDFFVPSFEELCFMLDRKKHQELQQRAAGGDICEVLDLDKDVRPIADQCMQLGAKVLLLKCGAPGMYLRTAPEQALAEISPRVALNAAAWADRDQFEKSYRPDQILSGTGAGDTSIAAFLTAILQGENPDMTLHIAAAAGASCVAAVDALSGLKPLEVLKRRIASGWEKV